MTAPLPAAEQARRRMAKMVRGRRLSRFEKQQCADRTCGTCIRCVRKRTWDEGKFAGKRTSPMPNAWPPKHEARLRELAGTMDRNAIAETLSREFPDTPRSVRAVQIRASKLGLSVGAPGFSQRAVSHLLGVGHARVERWVALGWLQTFPYNARAGVHLVTCRVNEGALKAFFRAHGDQYDPRGVVGTSPLADMARLHARGRVPQRSSAPRGKQARTQVREVAVA